MNRKGWTRNPFLHSVSLASVVLIAVSIAGCGGGKFGKRPTPEPEAGASTLPASVARFVESRGELRPWSDELEEIADFTGSVHRLIEATTCEVAIATAGGTASAGCSTALTEVTPDTGWRGVAEWSPEAVHRGGILLAQRLGRYIDRLDPQSPIHFAYGGFIHDADDSGSVDASSSLQGWFFVEPVFNFDFGSGHRTALDDDLTVAAAYGDASGTRPISGVARWNGVVVGVHVGGLSDGDVVHGSITLDVHLGGRGIDVDVHDLRNLSDDTIYGNGRLPSWTGLVLGADGSFGRVYGANLSGVAIEGRFYGRDHTSVGGVFRRNALRGAFGAARSAFGEHIPVIPPSRTWFDSERARLLLAPALGLPNDHDRATDFWGQFSADVEGYYGVTRTYATGMEEGATRPGDCTPGRLCRLGGRGVPTHSAFRFDFFDYVGPDHVDRDLSREAVLKHRDVSLALVEDPSGWGYGGWLDYAGFVVERLQANVGYTMGAYYVGERPTRPSDFSGVWSGVMVGVDAHHGPACPAQGGVHGCAVQGLSRVSIDQRGGVANVDVAFTGIHYVNDPSGPLDPLRWRVPLQSGGHFATPASSSSDSHSSINGQFFGPNGDEVAGVFDHRDPDRHLIGGFGAERHR